MPSAASIVYSLDDASLVLVFLRPSSIYERLFGG